VEGSYHLRAFDGLFTVGCFLAANREEITEYTTLYATTANQVVQPLTSGVPMTRGIVTRTGWHFEPRAIKFSTATFNSLHNSKPDGFTVDTGTSWGDATLKFYNSAGTELKRADYASDELLQAALLAGCTCTIMDWQPTYDMDIRSARIGLLNEVADDLAAYLFVIAAPDLPAIYGGNANFSAGGLDLRFIPQKIPLQFDGQGAKFLAYDPVYKTNKFRLKFTHQVGQNIDFMIVYEHYKA